MGQLKKDGIYLKYHKDGNYYSKEKTSYFSEETQLYLIGLVTKENISTLEARLTKVKEDLAFLQENYIFEYEEQFFVKNVVEAGWEFNREAFMALKESLPTFVTKTELCFNVETKDIGVKEKVAKILHETGKFDEASIFEIVPKVTEDSLPKLEILLGKQIYNKDYLKRIDKLDAKLLETLKDDPKFINYLEQGILDNLSPEDAAAKAEIYEFLQTRKAAIENGVMDSSAIDFTPQRRLFLEMAKAENIVKIKKAIEIGLKRPQDI